MEECQRDSGSGGTIVDQDQPRRPRSPRFFPVSMFKEALYYITAHFHDGKTDAITYVKAGSESSTKGAFSDGRNSNASEDQWERSNVGAIKRGSDQRPKQAYKNGKRRIENSRQFTQNQSFL
jgi:hypothetical protein